MTQKYYQQHVEEIKQRARDWYYQNKDKNRQYKNEWRRKNKEKYNQVQRRYRQKKAEQKRIDNFFKACQMFKDIKHIPFKNNEHIWILQNGKIFNINTLKFQKQQKANHGYIVSIGKNTYAVHRLIASAFDDRTKGCLDKFDCHHMDISVENNKIENLVFMDSHLHDIMHKHLSKELIILIGQKVKHLRGSQKTKQFEQLVRAQLANKITEIL